MAAWTRLISQTVEERELEVETNLEMEWERERELWLWWGLILRVIRSIVGKILLHTFSSSLSLTLSLFPTPCRLWPMIIRQHLPMSRET